MPLDNKKFVEAALKAHNEYRVRHKVTPLKHSKELTGVAQKWADHLASTGTFKHCPDRKFKGESVGENIAMKWTSGGDDFTGQQVTNQWYSEVSKYNYSHGGGSGTGHFTQVVWKDSKEFGIGRARGQDGKWIVVGNFVPAGNFMGRYQQNVFPPKDGKSSLIGDDEKPSGGAKKGFNIVNHHQSTPTRRPVQPNVYVDNTHVTRYKDDHARSATHTGSRVPPSGSQYYHTQHFTSPSAHVSTNIRLQTGPNQTGIIVNQHRRFQNHTTDSFPQSHGNDFGGQPFSSGFSHFKGFDSDSKGHGMEMDFPKSSGFGSHSGFGDQSSGSCSSGQVVSRQTKTVTEGVGANRKTKTIVTETVVGPDGSKKTTTTETVTSG